MRKFRARMLPFIAAAAFTTAASASTIQLGINGDAQIGSNYIDFGQYPNGAPYTPAPGYGTFEVSLVNAGVFSSAGVTTGEFGTIQSLNEPPGPVTLPGPFMTFDTGGSNLQLWVTNIPPGSVGPFTLTDTADGAVASFNVDGYVYDTGTSTNIDTFTGTFSATFDGQSVASLFYQLADQYTVFGYVYGNADPNDAGTFRRHIAVGKHIGHLPSPFKTRSSLTKKKLSPA